ncbi:MAG: hypoxanthine phosphoribosyltransferase [Eubacteriales bacterium]|nr:hypoxanthine phosphoribosyltransferase [Eubacteriales bacterium]
MNTEALGGIMITEKEIIARAEEIGRQISEDYKDEPILLLGILRGAVMWMTELMKHLTGDVEIDFMACSSYGASTKTSGEVKINKDLESDISGKNVIIVEDIVDSGITLQYLKGYLENRGPKSVRICALLDKPEGRRVDIEADYVGFTVGNQFIVGYGLDYAQKYRQLPYIAYIDESKI